MGMEMRQELKLTQQLVMTPQLQQAIKLLQMSRMELVDLVREELLENPVLEDGLDGEEAPKAKEATAADAESDGSREMNAVNDGPIAMADAEAQLGNTEAREGEKKTEEI